MTTSKRLNYESPTNTHMPPPLRKDEWYEPSVREALVARPGKILSTSDYEAGEMITWAEVCHQLLGFSTLGRALVAGVKPHSLLAARVMGISYEEFERRLKAGDKLCKAVRQVVKIFNFGCAGGMGPVMLLLQARANRDADTPTPDGPVMVPDGKGGMTRGYRGIRFCVMLRERTRCGAKKVREYRGRECPPVCLECLELAVQIRAAWAAQWPESEPYFALAARQFEDGYVDHVAGGRRSVPRGFCATANGHFQELLARAAKRALWQVSRACYDSSRESVLYGARPNGFFHDELIVEHPVTGEADEVEPFALASWQADEVGELMCRELRQLCPSVAPAVRVAPAFMWRWDKRAEAVRSEDGVLLPWTPPGRDPYADNAAATSGVKPA